MAEGSYIDLSDLALAGVPFYKNGIVTQDWDIAIDEKVRLIYTSHSIDNVFDYCPRKFEFLNIFDRRPPRDSGYAADIGTALHDGTQAWLIARAEGRNESDCQSRGFFAMMMKFPWLEEANQSTSARSFENTVSMLKEIMASNEWNDWELIRVEGHGWAVEVPFVIHHTSLGIFRIAATGELCMLATQGKIDFILRHKRTGKVRTWDLKTTIKDANLVRSEYTYSGQQVGYGTVTHSALGIGLHDFSAWYLIARFGANDPAQIEAIEVKKDEDDLDDYWLDKIDRLKRMRDYAVGGRFPRTNGGCNSYQHECSCFDICGTRDTDTIMAWFQSKKAVPQVGYEPWITLEL